MAAAASAAASAAFSIDTIDFQLGPGKEFNFKERGPIERKEGRKEGTGGSASMDQRFPAIRVHQSSAIPFFQSNLSFRMQHVLTVKTSFETGQEVLVLNIGMKLFLAQIIVFRNFERAQLDIKLVFA